MTLRCPHCAKTCKTENGLKQHVEFKHPAEDSSKASKPKKTHQLHSVEVLPVRKWIEPSVSETPDISQMIAVSETIYRHYSQWAETAVAIGQITPEDAQYRCGNALDVLRLLKWFKANEDAIKARTERKAA